MIMELYVATDLSYWEVPIELEYATPEQPAGRSGFAREVRQDGRLYRRLDGHYYVWLRTMVERAARAGHEAASWPVIRAWAIVRWGLPAVETADAMPLASGYRPPGK